MKQYLESDRPMLSDDELSETRGGNAGSVPHAPKGATGGSSSPLPKRPGETPPIIVIDQPLA